MISGNPRPLVLFGPSGSGKSTLLRKMLEDFPEKFGFSVSHTTRKPRPGEKHGVHYYFTEWETMKKEIDEGRFIEHAVYSGNHYGTSRAAVEAVQNAGKVCVLDIDVQGVKQIRNTNLNPWYVFIKPPSLEELEKRLRARNTESEESLKQRLKVAAEEMDYGLVKGNFDTVIVNNNLDEAYKELKEFLVAKVLEQKNGVDGK